MNQELLMYSLEMQSKFLYIKLNIIGGTQTRAQTGVSGVRKTFDKGEIKMIVEDKKTGNLQLESL